ncbi:MAG: hypothetical protein J5838_01865 [Desulfovibrio sp.]|nr:hypothetical protein [Desulfovibrio sp.]
MTITLKRMLCCLALGALFLASAAQAEPQKRGPVGHLAAGENEEMDKNSYVLTLKSAHACIDAIVRATQAALSAEAFHDCTRTAELETFRKFLLDKPFKEYDYGLAIASGNDVHREEITQIFLMLRHIGADFYTPMFRLVNIVKTGEYAKRLHAILKSADYLDDSWLDVIKKIDRAWFEFGSLVIQMERDDATDVTTAELFMASKIDKYAAEDMVLWARYDRMFRSLDAHLYAMRDAVLKKLQEDGDILEKYRKEASAALTRAKESVAGYSFYPKVEPIINNFETILAEIEGIEVVIKSCLNDAYNDGKTLGRLRRMKDLDPFGLLHAEGGAVRNGCPGYHERIQLALKKEKIHFMHAAERLNKKHQNRRGYKPIEWWR